MLRFSGRSPTCVPSACSSSAISVACGTGRCVPAVSLSFTHTLTRSLPQLSPAAQHAQISSPAVVFRWQPLAPANSPFPLLLPVPGPFSSSSCRFENTPIAPPTLHGGDRDYDLCITGYNTKNHDHKMEKLGLGLDKSNNQRTATTQSPGDSRRRSIQRCIQSLVHACQCRNANCSLPSCQKMKRVVQHTKGCKHKTNGGCPICKQLIALCCYHAKHCQENVCPVPFCVNIKHKLRQQQLQHRPRQGGG